MMSVLSTSHRTEGSWGKVSNVQVLNSRKLELLQLCINDENYLNCAIQRLALIMSNELMEITTEGGRHERQRKRRK